MVTFSTTPPTYNVNILLKNMKIIFVYIVPLSSKTKQQSLRIFEVSVHFVFILN